MHETLTEAMARVKESSSLAAYCDTHLEPHGKGFYTCPWCGSGSHTNHSAAFHIMPGDERGKCHSCGKSGDVYDIAGAICGTDDKAEQLEAVAQWAGVDGWQKNTALDWNSTVRTEEVSQTGNETAPNMASTSRRDGEGSSVVEGTVLQAGNEIQSEEPTADYTAFYREAHANLMASPKALDYLHSRGITDETAERFNLGYVVAWTHPKNAGKYPTDRIIMPRTAGTYTARAMDEGERYYNPAYKKQVVGHQTDLFNLEAARGERVVVVVEGELDAASVTQATGYVAIGLGSISNRGRFTEKVMTTEPAAAYILALDNDQPKADGRNPGRDAQAEIAEAMRAAGLTCYEADAAALYGECKDANELLVTDPERMRRVLSAMVDGIGSEEYRRQMERHHVSDPAEVARRVYDLSEARAPISTGFHGLDVVLGGGLHAKSLHVIGAQSSEGKTTITLQVADFIARSGHPVLFMTIEQRADELVAKSLSRIIWQGSKGNETISAREITNPAERAKWNAGKLRTLECARDAYVEEVAPYLCIMDPDELPDVKAIEGWAKVMADHYGEPPVIFVDYLQLLKAEDSHDTDKTATDKNVTALRQMAGRLNTAVWCVASLNRQSYTSPISTDSFKESGSIEYGADVLLGLEPFDLETRWFNAPEKKKSMVSKWMHDRTRRAVKRWMDLRVLKNRFGSMPEDGIPFVYHAPADTFEYVRRVNREKRATDEDMEVWTTEPMAWGEDDDMMVL